MITATGYVSGKATEIVLSNIDDRGHMLESQAALAFAQMAAAAKRDGFELEINSAFRDHVKQQSLWDRWQAKVKAWDMMPPDSRGPRPLRPARPGFSLHESGRAVDLDVFDERGHIKPAGLWLQEHAAFYGWTHPIDREPWHYSWAPLGNT